MNDVKRYDMHSSFGGAEIVERSYGDYVLHSDYEADTSVLLARIASLEREKEEARGKDDRNKTQLVSDGYKQVYNETYAELTSLREVVEKVREQAEELRTDGRSVTWLTAYKLLDIIGKQPSTDPKRNET